jgi:hypothetical protein
MPSNLLGGVDMPCKSLDEFREVAEKAQRLIDVDSDAIPFFNRSGTKLFEELRDCFIDIIASEHLNEAEEWVKQARRAVDELVRALGLKGFTYPREFRSFVEDPRAHLRKKIFNYAYDLVRGKMSPDDFVRRAGAAIRTSLIQLLFLILILQSMQHLL